MVSSSEQSSGCGSFACVYKCMPLMPAIPLLGGADSAGWTAEEATWHHSGWVWTWRYVWLCPSELLWVQKEKSCLLAAHLSAPSAVWPLLMSAAGLARASLESPSAVLNVSSLRNSLDPMCRCIAEAACSPICPRRKLRKLLFVWSLVRLESLSAVCTPGTAFPKAEPRVAVSHWQEELWPCRPPPSCSGYGSVFVLFSTRILICCVWWTLFSVSSCWYIPAGSSLLAR